MANGKMCRACGERPTLERAARCHQCVELALRKECVQCGALVNRRAKRCRSCNNSGAFNPAWKGGRYTDAKGYVRVKTVTRRGATQWAGHPRTDRKGYVFEHILVMEEKLGRYLVEGESVHHINGVRDDNRPENLELWLVKQPYGQRVEDLVQWAKEIIDRYG